MKVIKMMEVIEIDLVIGCEDKMGVVANLPDISNLRQRTHKGKLNLEKGKWDSVHWF